MHPVNLLADPHMTGDCNPLPHWRRLHDGSDLLRLTADTVLLVFLKHSVELERVCDPFSGQSDNQSALFCPLDLIRFQQMMQQHFVVFGCDIVEISQRQDAGGELLRRHFPAGGECGHRLVIEQAVGQAAVSRRLDPALLQIQLHQRNPLNQRPGNRVRKQVTGLRMFLAHDKPHLAGFPPPACPAHPLQK